MAVAVLATALSLWSLHRLDTTDGRRSRRILPASWWSFGRVDGLVVGTLLVWHIIGANTADDGYQLGMARAAGEAGYMANYFRWFGVPEAPFGTPFYDVLALMTHVSTASVWMRLPGLIAGFLAWWVISREVAPRIGAAVRRNSLPLWTGAFVFLAFWLPFNNGLRPEPIVATGVLLTWCSVERAIATRRLFPAAVAVLVGAVTVTAGPSGIICFAALIAGARPIARIVLARGREFGFFVVLAPIVAAGVVILAAVFADQTLAAVLEMQSAHVVGPSVPWFQEYLRYQYLLQITVDGSLARRFAMFTMILCLITVIVALLRRGGKIPGAASGPSRRLVGITLGAMVLMMFAPTKWTHHFGIYAGLAACVAIVAAVAVGPTVLRSRRNRALFAAAVLFTLTMSFIGPNGWWYVSSYGVPWWDKPPSVAGFGFSTVFFGLTVLALLLAAWWHIHPVASTRTDSPSRLWSIPPLTVAAAAMVLFEVLSLAKGAVSQYPGYSVARSNIDALTGSPCGLANDVLLEVNPNTGMLVPVGGDIANALVAEGGDGFTPNGVADDLTADDESADAGTANTVDSDNDQTAGGTAGTQGGTGQAGANGSTVALPFGLDPATTPVLGSYGGITGNVTTDWYSLPEPDAAGSRGDIVSISAAGRIFSVDADGTETYGQRLELEYGVTEGDTVRALGSALPIDIACAVVAEPAGAARHPSRGSRHGADRRERPRSGTGAVARVHPAPCATDADSTDRSRHRVSGPAGLGRRSELPVPTSDAAQQRCRRDPRVPGPPGPRRSHFDESVAGPLRRRSARLDRDVARRPHDLVVSRQRLGPRLGFDRAIPSARLVGRACAGGHRGGDPDRVVDPRTDRDLVLSRREGTAWARMRPCGPLFRIT